MAHFGSGAGAAPPRPSSSPEPFFLFMADGLSAGADPKPYGGNVAVGDASGRSCIACPRDGTLSEWRMDGDTDVTLDDLTITIFKNDAATALTFTVPVGQRTGADNTHTVSCLKGDLIAAVVTGDGLAGGGNQLSVLFGDP